MLVIYFRTKYVDLRAPTHLRNPHREPRLGVRCDVPNVQALYERTNALEHPLPRQRHGLTPSVRSARAFDRQVWRNDAGYIVQRLD